MNNPNPFIPQSALLEQMNRKRARAKLYIVGVFAVGFLVVCPALLINGCKRSDEAKNEMDPAPDTSASVSSNPVPLPGPAIAGSTATSSNPAPTGISMTPTPAPTPTPMPTPTPTPTSTDYTIVAGDSYSKIAKKFPGVTVKALMAENPDKPAEKLKVGQKIKIPAAATATVAGTSSTPTMTDSGDSYTVKSGDNLGRIATSYGTSVKALMAMNNLKSTRINTGQHLKVPARAGTAAPAMPAGASADTTPAAPGVMTTASATTPATAPASIPAER